jgi:HEAT repeat protein
MYLIGLALLARQESSSSAPAISAYPVSVHQLPAPDYLAWPGFGYLPAQGRVVNPHFEVPGDWSAIQAATQGVAAQHATPPTEWPVRIFILKRVDQVRRLEDGTAYEEQCALETVDEDRIKRAVTLLQQLATVETAGTLALKPQITVDPEPLLLGKRTLDQAIADYVTPRANGGKYDADDKQYRGPYQNIFVFHPIPSEDPDPLTVNHMPVQPVSVYGFRGYESDGDLAARLASQWCRAIGQTATRSGLLGPLADVPQIDPITSLASPLCYAPDKNWSALIRGEDLPAAQIQARLKLPHAEGFPAAVMTPKMLAQGYVGVTCRAEIKTDPERGSILAYFERGEARNGGLCFPSVSGASIDVSKTPTLSFWAKSSSKDPLAVECASLDGKTVQISLGSDRPGSVTLYKANFNRDGGWHQVKLDLRQTGLTSISEVRLAPTPNACRHPKVTLGPIEYDFASFAASTEAPDAPWLDGAPSADAADPWLRAKWAHAAKPSGTLLKLLNDPEWFVRLNALEQYVATPDATSEAALTENANLAIDGPTASAALDALWKLGTPSAKAVVHQTLKTGITEQGKAEAALLVASTKEAEMTPELIPLQQSRGLATRLAVIDALSELPGESASIVRMTFLYQDDPELKLEVTKTSDPNDSYQWKKMLWSAVNEGSDAVRLASYEKLTQSNDPTAAAGGFAGVKDDSIEVRVKLLQFLKNHPSEANRDALRQAVADRSARVKAAAIEAFSTMPKGATKAELGAALEDEHPVVQLALLTLGRSKKFALPDSVLATIAASPDPQVAAAQK